MARLINTMLSWFSMHFKCLEECDTLQHKIVYLDPIVGLAKPGETMGESTVGLQGNSKSATLVSAKYQFLTYPLNKSKTK